MRLTDIFIISLRKFIKISLDSNNLEFSGKMWNTDEEIFEFISKKYNIDVANEKSITIFLKNYSRKIITYPPLNNERIQRQCGAFICFPRYHYREKKSNFPTKHITIAADKKQAILDELKTMGITRAYLFPELDVQADDIKNNLFPRS